MTENSLQIVEGKKPSDVYLEELGLHVITFNLFSGLPRDKRILETSFCSESRISFEGRRSYLTELIGKWMSRKKILCLQEVTSVMYPLFEDLSHKHGYSFFHGGSQYKNADFMDTAILVPKTSDEFPLKYFFTTESIGKVVMKMFPKESFPEGSKQEENYSDLDRENSASILTFTNESGGIILRIMSVHLPMFARGLLPFMSTLYIDAIEDIIKKSLGGMSIPTILGIDTNIKVENDGILPLIGDSEGNTEIPEDSVYKPLSSNWKQRKESVFEDLLVKGSHPFTTSVVNVFRQKIQKPTEDQISQVEKLYNTTQLNSPEVSFETSERIKYVPFSAKLDYLLCLRGQKDNLIDVEHHEYPLTEEFRNVLRDYNFSTKSESPYGNFMPSLLSHWCSDHCPLEVTIKLI